jgi:hypothetical protein
MQYVLGLVVVGVIYMLAAGMVSTGPTLAIFLIAFGAATLSGFVAQRKAESMPSGGYSVKDFARAALLTRFHSLCCAGVIGGFALLVYEACAATQ